MTNAVTHILSDEDIHPYRGMDIPYLLERQARKTPDAIFLSWHPISDESRYWNFGEFLEAVMSAAAVFQEHGLQQGDYVIIHFENSPIFLISWFACTWLGCIAVTTNTRSSSDEFQWYIKRSGAKLIITSPELGSKFPDVISEQAIVLIVDESRDLESKARVMRRDPGPLLKLSVQFTSGTTSRPKGVLWTHANGLWGAQMSAINQQLTATDKLLVMMPLFHTNALVYSVLAALWVGASVVLLPRFSPTRFCEIGARERCTVASAPPFLLRALRALPAPTVNNFRLWGSSIADPEMATELGVPTIGWWGMTETIAQPIVSTITDIDARGSMGRASPGYRVRIVNEQDKPVPAGEVGSLQIHGIRGLSLFLEYLDDEDSTSAAFSSGGWFKTGDRVMLRENGTIEFCDREKDMLRIGGENVGASEIERVIALVNGVEEVAVVGAPHQMLDEIPIAFIVPEHKYSRADQSEILKEEILSKCELMLAAFKIPRVIQIVDSLPRHMVNKIDKKKLREISLELIVDRRPDTHSRAQ